MIRDATILRGGALLLLPPMAQNVLRGAIEQILCTQVDTLRGSLSVTLRPSSASNTGSARPVASVRCARRSWSRLDERRDVVGRGLGRLDQLSYSHARHCAVLLERASGDEHLFDVLGLAVEDQLGDRPE